MQKKLLKGSRAGKCLKQGNGLEGRTKTKGDSEEESVIGQSEAVVTHSECSPVR